MVRSRAGSVPALARLCLAQSHGLGVRGAARSRTPRFGGIDRLGRTPPPCDVHAFFQIREGVRLREGGSRLRHDNGGSATRRNRTPISDRRQARLAARENLDPYSRPPFGAIRPCGLIASPTAQTASNCCPTASRSAPV